MTREQKLQAVVDAARSALYAAPGAYERLSDTLAALDAHTEAEEVVTLAVWGCGGNVALTTISSRPTVGHPDYWHSLGIVTLPLTRERGR